MNYNFNRILNDSEFIDFNKKMDVFRDILYLNHTMVGFNYTKDKILSTKFYYVFYGELPSSDYFPIKELKDDYKSILPYYSKRHLLTKYLPGGGLTFTIKFDVLNRVSQGFFMRVDRDNSKLISRAKELYSQFHLDDNDFENGYGQYVMLHQDFKEYNQYVYLKSGDKLANLYDIPFEKADAVEMSSIMTNNDSKPSKIIAIGNSHLVTDSFYHNMPDDLLNLGCKNLVCPAIDTYSNQYSIYNISIINNDVNCNKSSKLTNHAFI